MRKIGMILGVGAMVLLPATSALGIGVVFDHDFEGDAAANEGLSGRGIGFFGPGDAVGAGEEWGNGGTNAGRFLPNLYDVSRQGTLGAGGDPATNWFENGVVRPGCDGVGIPPVCGNDVDPDTNWHPYVVSPTGASSALFDNEGWGNNTQVGLWQNNHQGDAAPNPGPDEDRGRTDRDNYGRDIFLQFTDAAGNPDPALAGQIVKGRFNYQQVSSSPVFVFTSDLEQMRQDNLVEANHPPLTTWGVVDGTELLEGIKFNDPKDYHVGVIASASGFGSTGPGQTWADDGSGGNVRVEWATNEFGLENNIIPGPCGTCFKGPFLLEFEFEVGASEFTTLRLTSANGTAFDPSDDITINLVQADDSANQNNNPNPGGPLPLAQPGAQIVEGLVFTDAYRKQAQYWVDNIFIEVIPEPASLSLLGLGGLMMIRRRRA